MMQKIFLKETGIHLGLDKRYLYQAGVEAGARLRHETVPLFLNKLRAGEWDAISHLVDELTTNETSFFRELTTFETLRKNILPQIISRGKGLRIWSAGCSTGQEPYSLAMLLLSEFPTLDKGDIEIVASDISRRVLERAEQGRFSQNEVNRGLPVTKMLRYFRQVDTEWQIADEVRRLVRFERRSLLSPWPTDKYFDLILCRNVLIYFDQVAKLRILHNLSEALQPDGFLALGTAESVFTGLDRFFSLIHRPTFYKSHATQSQQGGRTNVH